ncbi:MAG: OmpA family protein [Bacteroidetes bacterium]|nr:OmpA family protein [Bacteroidota bacterium]
MKFGTLLICLVFSTLSLWAQTPTEGKDSSVVRYGVYGNIGFTSHTADFRAFPGVPNCCPKFQTGSGSGLSFGVLYEIPFSRQWFMSLRAGYENYSANLLTRESELLAGGIQGQFEHRIATQLASVGAESWLGYELFPQFNFQIGVRGGVVVQKNYSQIEVIVEPTDNGVFSNGKSFRNDTSGIIPNANTIALNLLSGISYSLPLNSSKTLFLVPEFQFSLGLLPIISGYDWQARGIHFGIALKYAPKPSAIIPPIIPDDSLKQVPVIVKKDTIPPPIPEKKKPMLSASITAVGVNSDGVEQPIDHIKIEEFASTALHPLLQYVFFDENSAEIPRKYSRIAPENTNKFSLLDYIGENSMEVYYGLLNIVGYRMRTAPKSTVTLTGCNSNEGNEKNNGALSRLRAENVKKYLVETWGIAPKRLIVEQRNLPVKPSNSSVDYGREENRRVEISSDEGEIITAIVLSDTLRSVTPPILRFQPHVKTDTGLAEWSISALYHHTVAMKYEGKSDIKTSIDWQLTNQINNDKISDTITYKLDVRDNYGQETTAVGFVPLERITLKKKQEEKLTDKTIDLYNLILFDFDKAVIDRRNMSILNFVKKRISSNSRVSIRGFTDQTGDEEHNSRLALMRATAAAQALGLKPSVANSKSEQHFSNTTPEGRFYNRTVIIKVETAVK